MKDNIVVVYSTNRDITFQKAFNKEISSNIGCKNTVIAYENSKGEGLASVYNKLWKDFYKENSIFVFCHHDIHFKNHKWGRNLLNTFNNYDVDILGVAGTETLYEHGLWVFGADGMTKNQTELYGKVWHVDGAKGWALDKKGYPTEFTPLGKKIARINYVTAVDGLILVVNPDTCVEFDEDFDKFHFYDISFCVKNILAGKKIAVTETLQIVHESGGDFSEEWEKYRQLFCNKYGKELPISIKI